MRLACAFGTLQGEAVTGMLAIQSKPTDAGAAIRFDYVVGGYMRFKVAEIAPAVDRVLGEQLVGLAKALGGALSVAGEDESGNEAAGPARPDSNLADADRKSTRLNSSH